MIRYKNRMIVSFICRNSPTGQSVFRLSCDDAMAALRYIRLCICKAVIHRQQIRQQQQANQNMESPAENLSRRIRKDSATVSEKAIQGLLGNTTLAFRSDRSDSDSSGASMQLQHTHLAPQPLTTTSPASSPFERASIANGEDVVGGGGLGLGGELMFLEERGLSENSSVNALLRNNSHGSVGSISPVILRHGYSHQDIPQRGIVAGQSTSTLQNSSPGLSGSPTESVGIGGSPSNRSKRSSDNVRISTPELEAVPERDENSEGVNGSHVNSIRFSQSVAFDLGSVSIKPSLNSNGAFSVAESFDELLTQPLGNHKRYSSLPVTDSGYSVIKDVSISSIARERAATVCNNCCEIAKVSVSIAEKITRERIEFEDHPTQPVQDTKVEGQYQEIDKKENPYSTIGGRCGRRRSSSLSDLGTAKYTSKTPHFENVYEDVDELRETMKKLMIQKEDPPELPARPLSVSFSVPLQQTSPHSKPRADTVSGSAAKSVKKRRLLFSKNKQNSSLDLRNNEMNLSQASSANIASTECTCNIPSSKIPLPSAPSFAQCSSCGGSVPIAKSIDGKLGGSNLKSNLRRTVSSSTEELIHASDSSSFSELYADIAELRAAQGKRRRSSDITPVMKSLLDVSIDSPSDDITSGYEVPRISPIDSKNGRVSTLERSSASFGMDDQKPPALPERRHSPPSQPRTIEVGDLIQFVDGMEKKNAATTPAKTSAPASLPCSPKASPHQPPQASDPLISFFLDDSMFQDNPMVTGILPVSRPLILPQSLTSNNNPFPLHLDSIHTSNTNPFSTPSNGTSIRDSNNNSSRSSSPISPFINFNDMRGKVSPLNFTNPFTEDLFLWTHAETSANGHLHPSVSEIKEENYLSMSSIHGSNKFLQRQVVPDESMYMTPTGN